MHKAFKYLSVASIEKSVMMLWLVFFVYATVVAFFVQMILLPHVIPAWHAGHGLLVSYFDAQSAHMWATTLAEKIHSQGWSAWQLRYNGQGNVGITAAIYTLTLPEPWVLIPLHAALHATAALLLLLIINIVLNNRRWALISVLPFLLYPSAMTWYTQILKDGYSITGVLMITYGWILLARQEEWAKRVSRLLLPLLLIILGTLVIWVVRPFVVGMMQMLCLLIAVVVAMAIVRHGSYQQWRGTAITLLGLLVVWFSLFGMKFFIPVAGQTLQVEGSNLGTQANSMLDSSDNFSRSEESGKMQKTGVPGGIVGLRHVTSGTTAMQTVFSKAVPAWHQAPRLLASLDSKFMALSGAREGFRTGYPMAASNIDSAIKLTSAMDVIKYLPRAAQIAFFSPFPVHWIGKGSLEANTLMRRITAFEMMGVYFALLFLPYSVWYWRKRIELWIVLLCTVPPLLIYGIVFANLGTLYRMRYGFLMTLVALGLAGFITLCRHAKQHRARNGSDAV